FSAHWRQKQRYIRERGDECFPTGFVDIPGRTKNRRVFSSATTPRRRCFLRVTLFRAIPPRTSQAEPHRRPVQRVLQPVHLHCYLWEPNIVLPKTDKQADSNVAAADPGADFPSRSCLL